MKRFLSALLVVALNLASAQASRADVFGNASAFEILQYPGAVDTWPEDIYDGLIVGRYRDTSGRAHGFTYDGSTYSTLDVPGSRYTSLFGIDGTNIVGAYYDSAVRQLGFLFDGNSFKTIAPPDTSTTLFNGAAATGVDGQTIVGGYYNTSGDSSGFIFDGLTYTRFGFSAGNYAPQDIEDGKIVGLVFGQGTRHGFIYDGQTNLNLFHPDAGSLGTEATGVSGNRVVGYYYEESPRVKHSFIYEQGEFRTYDVPARLGDDTEIRGIQGDKIVGFYIGTSGGYYGFVATIPEPHTLPLLATICLSRLVVRRPANGVLSRRCAR
jgi:hypothetical protein